MTDTMDKGEHRKTARSASRSGNGKNFEDETAAALSRAGQSYLYTMAALNEAAVQVVNEQMNANAEAARMLGQCHDFGEAMQVHSKLLRCSSEACMKGWARWFEASSQYMSGTFTQT